MASPIGATPPRLEGGEPGDRLRTGDLRAEAIVLHSYLSATMGSTCVAWRAGI